MLDMVSGDPPAERDAPTVDDTMPAPTPPGGGTGGRFVVGQRLGRYEIVSLLGRGGMGEVYAAYDPQLDRAVAVKVLLDATGDRAAARLVREAQALARLHHPNVVAVYDGGEDGGHVFLAMQLVDGETLAVHLRRGQRRWQEIVGLFVEAGRGLAAAHRAGIIHRDFKPANVLVDRAGHVAVTDFGVARAAGDTAPFERPSPVSLSRMRPTPPSNDLTRQGELVGTPAYMAAEQLRSGATTPASDQYAFCVALWEALFERHPYLPSDAEPTPITYAVSQETGPLITPDRTAVPKRVVTALARGLASDPAGRWPSMTALLDELDGARRSPRQRRRGLILAKGVAAGAVVSGLAAFAIVSSADDEPASCEALAAARIADVWTPAKRDALTAAFVATGRPYAHKFAATARTNLDAYGGAWQRAHTVACLGGRRGDDIQRERAAVVMACMDRVHAAFNAAVTSLTVNVSGPVVDQAGILLDDLPAVADCAAAVGGVPPPAIARRLAALEPRLAKATSVALVGKYRQARADLEALQRDAADLGWEPFAVQLALVAASVNANIDRQGAAELAAIARRATAIGAHGYALDAWIEAMLLAADRPTLETYVAAATEEASAIGGPRPRMRVSIQQGRALVRLRRYPEAAVICRDALATAQASKWEGGEMQVLDCLVEALVPMNKFADVMPLIERNMALKGKVIGFDHPAQADLLIAKTVVHLAQRQLPEAMAAVERGLAIRRAAYGDDDPRVGDALRAKADVVESAGDVPQAIALAHEALAIIESNARGPRNENELYKTHRDLGIYYERQKNFPKVREHFDQAIAAATRFAGADSIEVAFLLMVYGQFQANWDIDAGIASLRRAVAILEAHRDPRISVVRAALSSMLLDNDRVPEALELLTHAVPTLDFVNTPPVLLAQIHFIYAKAKLRSKHDKREVRRLADRAVAFMERAGNHEDAAEYRAWIKQYRLPAAN